MSDEQMEAGELTERFRAFAQSVDPKPSRAPRIALRTAALAVLVATVTLLVVLLTA